MQDKKTHIIQRQVFELSAASSKASLEWEKSATHFLHAIIKPCIEACFDELPLRGKHLVIEKLEIDLGVFATGRFEKEAYARLKEMLSRQLQELAGAHEIVDQDRDQYDGDPHESSAQGIPVEDRPSAVRLSETKAVQQILLSFLSSGRFPWWHRMHGHPQYLDEHFNLVWMSALPERGKMALKRMLRDSEAARIRLSNHFRAEWIGGCLQLLDMKGEEGIRQLNALLPALVSYPSLKLLFHQHFWMMWMEAEGNIRLSLLVERTAGGKNALSTQIISSMRPLCEHDAALKDHVASLQEQTNEGPEARIAAVEKEAHRHSTINEIQADIAAQSLQRRASTSTGKAAEEDALFIEAAGMVLLHPFLPELFRMTGLWEDQQWCSAQAPFRALQLLSWLAFGETGLHEYRLVFLKILAGMDTETPVPAEPPLSEEEKAACRELLQAVIHHWNALRSTSPDGLQEGFLQRNGKLLPTGDEYLLRVEPQAQDVLLSRLPWGYAIVKLPWMKQMLHVTWI